MTPWRVGDEIWSRYYDSATGLYTCELMGHVAAVGRESFTVRMVPRYPKAPTHQTIAFADAGSYWRSKAEGDAAIALRPSPNVPRGPGRS